MDIIDYSIMDSYFKSLVVAKYLDVHLMHDIVPFEIVSFTLFIAMVVGRNDNDFLVQGCKTHAKLINHDTSVIYLPETSHCAPFSNLGSCKHYG